jgi:hypothetical protein
VSSNVTNFLRTKSLRTKFYKSYYRQHELKLDIKTASVLGMGLRNDKHVHLGARVCSCECCVAPLCAVCSRVAVLKTVGVCVCVCETNYL